MKPRILHISADFPDPIQPNKTQAIAGLVEGTADEFEHLVISLNREGGLTGLFRIGQVLEGQRKGNVLAVRYAAPPAGVAIGPVMALLAEKLGSELQDAGLRPDLIQGHKLTIEGRLAQRLAEGFGVPYALTLQGNTDQKLLVSRPDRSRVMRQVWHEASAVMAFAPWTASWCSERLGPRAGGVEIIPCVLPHDAVMPPQVSGQIVRTAFHLDFWRNKNIATLLAAVSMLVPDFPELQLEIAGAGSPATIRAISRQIAAHALGDRVRLVGPIASQEIQAWFHGAAVFALPSRRESFGMVFVEALLAGTPVIHPSGGAIDGFFPGKRFAREVLADDARSLAAALAELLTHQAAIKAELAAAQAAGDLTRFRRGAVLAAYRKFLNAALR